jgi:putative DNA primase/helicase
MHGPWPSRAQVALPYGSCGWHVFPLHTVDAGRCSCGDPGCGLPGEHPQTPNGVKDASADPEQIRAWWKQGADPNIGLATGAVSKLVVLAIDPLNGGDKSYEQLQKELPNEFKALSKVWAGSGRFHLYFEHPGPLPSRASIRPSIDVIADGGYVVAPPSVHASGEKYRFTSSNGFAPPPLPPALRDLILREAQAHGVGQEEPKIRIDVESLRVSEKRAREKPDQQSGTEAPPHGNSSNLICRRASEISPRQYVGSGLIA